MEEAGGEGRREVLKVLPFSCKRTNGTRRYAHSCSLMSACINVVHMRLPNPPPPEESEGKTCRASCLRSWLTVCLSSGVARSDFTPMWSFQLWRQINSRRRLHLYRIIWSRKYVLQSSRFLSNFPGPGHSVGTTGAEMVRLVEKLRRLFFFCYLLLRCTDKSKIQIHSAGFHQNSGRHSSYLVCVESDKPRLNPFPSSDTTRTKKNEAFWKDIFSPRMCCRVSSHPDRHKEQRTVAGSLAVLKVYAYSQTVTADWKHSLVPIIFKCKGSGFHT